jgi:hypothetical protein
MERSAVQSGNADFAKIETRLSDSKTTLDNLRQEEKPLSPRVSTHDGIQMDETEKRCANANRPRMEAEIQVQLQYSINGDRPESNRGKSSESMKEYIQIPRVQTGKETKESNPTYDGRRPQTNKNQTRKHRSKGKVLDLASANGNNH